MGELARRVFHILSGIVIVILIQYGYFDIYTAGALILIGFILSFLSLFTHVPVLYPVLRFLDRKKDMRAFPGKGAIFYCIGVFLLFVFFKDIDLISAAILILAFGDSIAPVFGKFGKVTLPYNSSKTLIGVFAGMIAAFIAASPFVVWHAALIASFFAMIAESFGEYVDDNVTMPVVAGFVIWLII